MSTIEGAPPHPLLIVCLGRNARIRERVRPSLSLLRLRAGAEGVGLRRRCVLRRGGSDGDGRTRFRIPVRRPGNRPLLLPCRRGEGLDLVRHQGAQGGGEIPRIYRPCSTRAAEERRRRKGVGNAVSGGRDRPGKVGRGPPFRVGVPPK
eukprot:scaffold907_cov318-Pavlova_lutheri.AAC.1